MILIYSKDVDEFVNQVVLYLGKDEFVRIGTHNGINIDSFVVSKNDSDLIISSKYKNKISLNAVKSVWFNGGSIFKSNSLLNTDLSNLINQNYSTTINSFLNSASIKKLGNVSNDFICNKIDVLIYAQKIGLLIPNTLFTENKEDLLHFYKKHISKGIISKRISDSLYFHEQDYIYNLTNTFDLDDSFMNEIPNQFGISQFQEKIEKQFEVRVVYVFDKFYAMAIFPIKDGSDNVDYRLRKNHRMIPYNLPIFLREKLKVLMSQVKLNIGSIDFIVDEKNDFYLLEINQCGQISFLNNRCNYQIEKEVVRFLRNT